MTNILITGGAGFVGYHLAKKEADKGNEVTIMDNFERPNFDQKFKELTEQSNVIFYNRDASSEATYKELAIDYYDLVYHLAALNGTSNFYKFPAKVLKIGCLSTIYLLDWIASHTNRPKVIYTSSSETYAGTTNILGEKFPIPTPEDIPLAIDDVTNVRWSYGTSKLVGEVAFYCYSEMYDINDFNIIRLHNIYGPRMGSEHVISQFIIRFLNGTRPFKIMGGNQTRSFCFIDDVLEAFEKIADSGVQRQIIHVGNDKEEIQISDLAKLIFDIGEETYDFDEQVAPAGSVSRRCPQIDKLKSLGVTKQIALRDGVEQTFSWYKKNHLEGQ
jgi:nucleoside-diphosphate-sugar epimerase